jgi:hypothetical protein
MRKASSSSQTASKEVSFTLIGAIMSFEENTQQQSKAVTSHYWGYRELEAHELAFVGGGYDGDTADGYAGDGGGGWGDAASSNTASPGGLSEGARGCTPADSPASCAARTEGYAMCDALSNGVTAAAALTGNSTAQSLAAEVGPACNRAVDATVDAAYKTDMYENGGNRQNMSYDGYDGSN